MIWTLVLVVGFGAMILYLRRPHLFHDLREELSAVWSGAKAEFDESRRPDASAPETDAAIAAYRALARPALLLRPDEKAAAGAAARLGGPAWFADGEQWPVNADGKRLEFIAQYDLSRLPRLDGLPERGVARFFVGRDDIWGANFDDPHHSDARVLWHDGLQQGGRTEQPTPLAKEDYSPFMDTGARSTGLALSAEPAAVLPDFYSWQLQAEMDSFAGKPDSQELENEIFELSQTRGFAHKIGGHPTFTQYDFREAGNHEDLDVLLLGLTSDDSIMWGDVGEAMFLISREDLERRDFSRVAFYWDCH